MNPRFNALQADVLSSDDEEDFDGEDEAADGLDEGEEDEIDYEDDDDEVRHGCC